MATFLQSLQQLIPKQVQAVINKVPQSQAVKTLTPYVQQAVATVQKAATPQNILKVAASATPLTNIAYQAGQYVGSRTAAKPTTTTAPKPTPLPPGYTYTAPKPGTQTFGSLNKITPTGNKAGGGGAIVAAPKPANTQSVGQVMGAFAPSDINPQTGLPYAINPATGEWDMGYYNYIVKFMKEKNVPLATIQAMQKYSPANIKYTDIEKEELAKATPYYERLLKESNWDIDQAKAKMKEEYDLGVKTERQNRDFERSTLATQTAPKETAAAVDELAQRGLLGTVAGEAMPLEVDLSTGEKLKATTPGITKAYGGIAGGRLGTLLESQKARAEAITKAQQSREAEMEIPYRYGTTAYEEERKRKAAQLEQEKRKEAAAAAATRYGRETDIAGQKVQGLLMPYI